MINNGLLSGSGKLIPAPTNVHFTSTPGTPPFTLYYLSYNSDPTYTTICIMTLSAFGIVAVQFGAPGTTQTLLANSSPYPPGRTLTAYCFHALQSSQYAFPRSANTIAPESILT